MHKKFFFRGVCLTSLLCARLAHSAVFNIPNGDVASLKNAIAIANSNGQADVINLAANGTYTLTTVDNTLDGPNGLPSIENDAAGLDLTINGNGATIRRSANPGTPEFRILRVGLDAAGGCDGLTIAGGALVTGSFPANRAGGILVTRAMLTLTNCVVRENSALEAGGIFNSGSALIVNGCLLTANTATRGGGIWNLEGSVSGSSCTFSDNVANGTTNSPGTGGAIYNASSSGPASVTLSGCQFTGNRITGAGIGHGGAIFNWKQSNASASLALTNCTLSGNYGDEAAGGAISNANGAVTLTGGKLDHNRARDGGGIEHGFGSVVVRGVTFETNTAVRNTSTNAGGLGGAILLSIGGTLSVSDSVFTGNDGGNSGGAIYNSGTVTVTNCDFTANAATFFGGAIRNDAELTLSNSRLLSNASSTFGGGIFNTSNLSVERCTVNANTSGAAGGIANSGTLALESSTLDGNKAQGSAAEGGAIGMLKLNPPISTAIRNSTLSNNTATRGGGVFNLGTLTVFNSTLSGNSASGEGGALCNRGGESALYAATLFGNSAANGGGIYNVNTSTNAVVQLSSTILRSGSSGANLLNASGDIFSYGYNLSNDPAGGDATTAPGGLLNNTGDIRNTNPNLGSLQNNGGPTQTHALGFPSPAMEAGDDDLLEAWFGLTNDQRGAGFTRRVGARIDIGAFEAGATLRVTTIDDHNDGACSAGDCTLREAIVAANAGGPSNITFAPNVAGTIQLNSELPALAQNLSVRGPGAKVLTVRRNTGGDYRILTISNGTSKGPAVRVRGLTMTNGRAPELMAPNNSGGGILNFRGTLIVEECSLVGNSVADSATGRGGGLFNSEGAVSVVRSTVAGNIAHSGGGVASSITTGAQRYLDLRSSTISGNTAQGGDGGGIHSVASNSGSRSDMTLADCTLSGNSATATGFIGGAGGAIYHAGFDSGEARLRLEDCTLSGNNGANTGGIYNANSGGIASVSLHNSILKSGAAGGNLLNSNGEIVSLGYNLSDDLAGDASNNGPGPGGFLNASGDMRNTDPQLGPLQDDGGPTQTHALLAASPAINAAANGGYDHTDQRGYLRRGLNDIGAFEFNGVCLRITGIARTGNDVVVSFDAAAGLVFALRRTNSVEDAAWSEIPNVDLIQPMNDGIAQIIDPGAATLARTFYRVELLIP